MFLTFQMMKTVKVFKFIFSPSSPLMMRKQQPTETLRRTVEQKKKTFIVDNKSVDICSKSSVRVDECYLLCDFLSVKFFSFKFIVWFCVQHASSIL